MLYLCQFSILCDNVQNYPENCCKLRYSWKSEAPVVIVMLSHDPSSMPSMNFTSVIDLLADITTGSANSDS
jgi:hypothetical protein